MELLCTDVKLIVYRYLLDDRYRLLREQFKARWLNVHGINWDDIQQCYRYGGVSVANWRCYWRGVWSNIQIYSFDNNLYGTTAYCPDNY